MNRFFLKLACAVVILLAARMGSAGVVVIQNVTVLKFPFTIHEADGKETRRVIVPTDIVSIPATAPVVITLGEGPGARSYTLEVNSIHYFQVRNGLLDVVHLKLPGMDDKPAKPAGQAQASPAQAFPAQAPGRTPGQIAAAEVYKIPVAILTDSTNTAAQPIWEKKIRKRLAEASDIFEHHCRVRFEVVKVGNWTTDPAVRSFDQALMEFAQKVPTGQARVAIGFTTHYVWLPGEMHLGGTHGALATHVLIRESPGQVSEPERLEVLVHELGHFLGAAHTSDLSSVMRPVLGDKQSAARSFRIGFDAPNTLIMSLVAEELRTRHLWHPSALSPDAKIAVHGAYMVLAQSIPDDPVSKSSMEMLGRMPPKPPPPGSPDPQLINGARHVVRGVVQAARENQQLPVHSNDPRAPVWRTDDDLTNYYVRRAAAAARQLPPKFAPSAFLLGLGVALDDSSFVRDKPVLNDVWKSVDTDDLRQQRLLLLGAPTMFKRHNLTRHFVTSAALVVLSGPQGAETTGLSYELLESRSGNSFSFAELCADMSGVLFATHVKEDDLSLADLASHFKVEDYVPKLDGLPDDLTWEAFVKQYGQPGSDSFQKQRADLYHRILALPAYRAPAGAKEFVPK
jgi:hypothetical protein